MLLDNFDGAKGKLAGDWLANGFCCGNSNNFLVVFFVELLENPKTLVVHHFPEVKYHFPMVGNDFPEVKYHFPVVGNHFPEVKYHFPVVGNDFPEVKYHFPVVENQIPMVGNDLPMVENQIPIVGNQIRECSIFCVTDGLSLPGLPSISSIRLHQDE
ncbi:MAG: hypothetical protein ACEPOZ_09270 [Marinifilaceae bacterium]